VRLAHRRHFGEYQPMTSLSDAPFEIAVSGPVRAAAGARELVWSLLGNVALHASLLAVASVIPLRSAAWFMGAVYHAPSGDNTIELSAAFLDSAAASQAEPAESSPILVTQTVSVTTTGDSNLAPREVELSPLGSEPAPRDFAANADSTAEAIAQSKALELETPRRQLAQEQPTVTDAPQESTSSPSRSVAAAPPAVGSPDALPSEIHSPFPAYPPELLARRIQATVVLRVKIAADGSVADATVHRTSGYAAMDQAAIAGVKSWKFKPAIKNGQPVETVVRKPFTFEIRE
jgi:protein TonB